MLVVIVVAMAARWMMLMVVVVARVNAATTAVNDGVATASTDAAAAAAMLERCTTVWTQKRREVSTGQRSAAIHHRSIWLDVTAHVPVVAKVTTHRKTGPGTYKRRAFSSLTELSSF